MQIRFSADLENGKSATVEVNGKEYRATILSSSVNIVRGNEQASQPRLGVMMECSLGPMPEGNSGTYLEMPAEDKATEEELLERGSE